MGATTPGGVASPGPYRPPRPTRVERRNDKNDKKRDVSVHTFFPDPGASLAGTPRTRRYCFVLDLIFDLA